MTRPLFLTAALVLGGCFQTDTVLTVRPDGSARLVETAAVEGILSFGLPMSMRELGPPTLPGAELVGVTTAERTGAAVATTTWEVPDVSALRYDLRDAGRVATILTGLARWANGQSRTTAHTPGPLTFAFAAGSGGAPARLQVDVGRALRAADLLTLPGPPTTSAPLGDYVNQLLDSGVSLDAVQALLRGDDGSEAGLPEPTAEGRANAAALLDYLKTLPLAEHYVRAGTAAVRFSVAVEGELADASGGWREADRLVVADVSLAEAFPTLDGLTALSDSAAAARFDAASEALGIDRPGLRVPAPGPLTVRFHAP